jgi:SAM-dependent methyltransferase
MGLDGNLNQESEAARSTDVPCPLCGSVCLQPVLERVDIPVMQNVVFHSRAEAQQSPRALLALSICGNCGFAFNSCFDADRLQYDARYDNTVRSAAFGEYYAEIADYLHAEHALDGKFVVDVGCGQGTFLEVLCGKFPRCAGKGIDPSIDENRETADNLEFVRDVIQPSHLTRKPDLVLCRHVLEHIPDPVAFLDALRKTLPTGTAFFLEVPDLDWIMEAGAFWDFCYEHCNYFTARSFAAALDAAGFRVSRVTPAFGAQYLWAEGVLGDPSPLEGSSGDLLARAQSYAREEKALMERVGMRLQRAAEDGACSALWGMATKGVLFANLCDPGRQLIEICVDKNEAKQGSFIAGTGHRIDAPTMLAEHAGKNLDIYIMNPNYADEIKAECRAMALTATFLTPAGEMVV